jgi:hypothetical protein
MERTLVQLHHCAVTWPTLLVLQYHEQQNSGEQTAGCLNKSMELFGTLLRELRKETSKHKYRKANERENERQ